MSLTATKTRAASASVEAVDPLTVKITWKEPNANSYLSFVGGFGGVVLQKKQFAECKGAAATTCAANNTPVGTGPFILKEFKPGDVVTYEKNPAAYSSWKGIAGPRDKVEEKTHHIMAAAAWGAAPRYGIC